MSDECLLYAHSHSWCGRINTKHRKRTKSEPETKAQGRQRERHNIWHQIQPSEDDWVGGLSGEVDERTRNRERESD